MFKATPFRRLCSTAAALAALSLAAPAAAAPAQWPSTNKGLWPLGVFEKENLEKPRPKAPWDMTGTWTMKNQPETGGFNFTPLPKFKPPAQKIYEEYLKATAEGNRSRGAEASGRVSVTTTWILPSSISSPIARS